MQNKTALILVDFEKEWIDPNSEYYVGDISDTITKINELIDLTREKNYKIIFTTHIEEDSEKEFAPKSENVEIIDEIKKKDTDILIKKYRISPFYNTSLENELKGIERILVGGILTNLCVRSLVQDAYDRDFNITVVTDICVAFDQQTQDFTLKDLKETREEIEFINSIELLK